MSDPVTIAVVNDYDLVVAGVAAPPQQVSRTYESSTPRPAGNGTVNTRVDVALFDTFGQRKLGLDRIKQLVRRRPGRHRRRLQLLRIGTADRRGIAGGRRTASCSRD